jgi:hypothetical protein
MSILSFFTELSKGGVASAATFEVMINAPNGNRDQERDLLFRCSSVDLPGKGIQVKESITYGAPHPVAITGTGNSCEIEIILSENLVERDYILKWQDKILGNHRNGKLSGNMWDIGYYKDYVRNLDIYKINDLDEIVHETRLIDAFPSTVGTLQMSWDQGSAILRLPVTFTYRYFTDKVK